MQGRGGLVMCCVLHKGTAITPHVTLPTLLAIGANRSNLLLRCVVLSPSDGSTIPSNLTKLSIFV